MRSHPSIWGVERALIPSSRLTIPTVLLFARPTSASLNAVMICSEVCRLLMALMWSGIHIPGGRI